jgi:hypothetical protein
VPPAPRFLERDGAYHRVTVSSERVVERDRRLFYVDLLDGEPDGDGPVASPPFASLDERDATVLSAALGAVYADRGSPLDNGELDDPNAVTYHEDLDAGESALVPSPPFEYVQYEDRYYEAVAERASVPVTERTFAVERVASTREGLREHVLSALPATRFSQVSLSGDARGVLDDAVDDDYTEPPPASTALTDVLSPLGIADALDPYDQYEDEARFRGVLARYDGTWYEFDLTVTP